MTQGHAVAYRRYSSGYVQDENEAKAAKLGIWAGAFTLPAEWPNTGACEAGRSARGR